MAKDDGVSSSHIRPLDFREGLEDVRPVEDRDRQRLPPPEQLQPSARGPASPIEELIDAETFDNAIDSCIEPDIIDMSVCRPERYDALLAESQQILAETLRKRGSDPDLDGLAAVLHRQKELRGLLRYYVQSLLNA
ncbi:MAG: hypothetical protein AAF637_03135 [Pseudomonadota bacterium]